jgi:hypothetical protein
MDTYTYLRTIALEIATIWFVAWGLRKKYELDETLDLRGWIVRAVVVLVGFMSLCFRSPEYMYARVIGGGAATAMIVWPNFAYHISRGGRDD